MVLSSMTYTVERKIFIFCRINFILFVRRIMHVYFMCTRKRCHFYAMIKLAISGIKCVQNYVLYIKSLLKVCITTLAVHDFDINDI